MISNNEAGSKLVAAYKRIAVIKAGMEVHPLSTGIPFNPVNFAEEQGINRTRYLSMTARERAKLHARLMHGIFQCLDVRQSDHNNTDLFLESFDARQELKELHQGLAGKILHVHAVHEDDFPIERMRKHLWSNPALVERHMWQTGEFIGPLDLEIPESQLVFAPIGNLYHQASIIDSATLKPRVAITVTD